MILYKYDAKSMFHSKRDSFAMFSIVSFVGCHNFITLSCEPVIKVKGLSSKVQIEFMD